MPRNGSGIYSKPFPDVVAGTTIESAVHNGTVSDVETDLNAPRPVVAGGTGATSAAAARTNLQAEVNGQTVTVANYDTHPFESGSFHSNALATGAPTADAAYTGTCVVHANTQYVNIEVVEVNSPTVGLAYLRQKKLGVWGAWKQKLTTSADLDTRYVNVTGDTMTGDLTINKLSPAFTLNRPDTTTPAVLFGQTNGSARWRVVLGNAVAETGSNVGSDFGINRYNDAGVLQASPITITRAAGVVAIDTAIASSSPTTGALTVAGGVGVAGSLNVGGAYIQLNSASTNPYLAIKSPSREYTIGVNLAGYGVDKFTIWDNTVSAMRMIIHATGSAQIVTNIVSTSTSTGTLVVSGGLGVAGALHMNGVFSIGGGMLPVAIASVRFNQATNVGLAVDNNDSVHNAFFIHFFRAGGVVQLGSINNNGNTGVSYFTTSDRYLKENEKPFDRARAAIDALEVWDFKWKGQDHRDIGLFAQDAAKVLPNATMSPSEQAKNWMIDYSKFVPLLIADAKETHARLAAMEEKLNAQHKGRH